MIPFPDPKVPYTELQRREASDWFLLIHDKADPKPDALQAWLRWMDQDEGNRVAFESVVQAWHTVSPSSALAMPTAEELADDGYSGDQPVDQWLAERCADAGRTQDMPQAPSLPFARVRRAWLAAASLAAITLGSLTMDRQPDSAGSRSDEFVTTVGEQLQITLADGSHVWLGPKSKLVVAFTQQVRSTQLAAGEAFFTVHKDHHRPFTVRSVGGDITAVGTAFNVRAVQDRVTVAVSEGVVTVAPMEEVIVQEPTTVRVASGQQVTFTAREPIQALAITQTPSLGERARWRDGVLVYRDEPLRDVVTDVVRYSDKQIDIVDPAIGELHYSGIVYKSAIQEWTNALPESFPVKIVSEANRVIIKAR
jgi:transmembrane sensor